MERINKLKEFLQANPHDSFLEHALALEYIKLGNDAEARLLFEGILQREPGYTGSYYHLGKLLERAKEWDAAIGVYDRGMEECLKAADKHAWNELQMAREEITEE